MAHRATTLTTYTTRSSTTCGNFAGDSSGLQADAYWGWAATFVTSSGVFLLGVTVSKISSVHPVPHWSNSCDLVLFRVSAGILRGNDRTGAWPLRAPEARGQTRGRSARQCTWQDPKQVRAVDPGEAVVKRRRRDPDCVNVIQTGRDGPQVIVGNYGNSRRGKNCRSYNHRLAPSSHQSTSLRKN